MTNPSATPAPMVAPPDEYHEPSVRRAFRESYTAEAGRDRTRRQVADLGVGRGSAADRRRDRQSFGGNQQRRRNPMTDHKIDAVTLTLPRQTPCGLCNGEPWSAEAKKITGTDACPQCGGHGANPFPPTPYCGHEGCEDRGVTLAGYDAPNDGNPIYRCSAGHYTCVAYEDADDPELVKAGDAAAKDFFAAMDEPLPPPEEPPR